MNHNALQTAYLYLSRAEQACLIDPARRTEAVGMLDDLEARCGMPSSITLPATCALVALEFSRVLRTWLTDHEMADVLKRNATPEYAGCCASHDVCDANIAMLEAFRFLELPSPVDGANNERATLVWNAAWDMARESGFTL